LPNSSTTAVEVFGFQAVIFLIAPADTNVAHEFLLAVARAVDLERYLTFHTGLLRAENLVMAASVLLE
jgi:hypothetical protein